MKSKKGMELPINVVVMTIIGLVIFAMGLALFAQISEEAENTSEGLQDKIKSHISSLECDGEDWVCAPSIKTKLGRSDTFEVFIANRGEENKKFKIEVEFPSPPWEAIFGEGRLWEGLGGLSRC